MIQNAYRDDSVINSITYNEIRYTCYEHFLRFHSYLEMYIEMIRL